MPPDLPECFDPLSAVSLSLDDLTDIRGPATYLVRVEGDSMTGAGIFPGDLLVVSKASIAVQGSIVIGVVNNEPMCKRLDYVQGRPVLRSENRAYADRYVLEHEELTVWGVVTHSVRAHL